MGQCGMGVGGRDGLAQGGIGTSRLSCGGWGYASDGPLLGQGHGARRGPFPTAQRGEVCCRPDHGRLYDQGLHPYRQPPSGTPTQRLAGRRALCRETRWSLVSHSEPCSKGCGSAFGQSPLVRCGGHGAQHPPCVMGVEKRNRRPGFPGGPCPCQRPWRPSVVGLSEPTHPGVAEAPPALLQGHQGGHFAWRARCREPPARAGAAAVEAALPVLADPHTQA